VAYGMNFKQGEGQYGDDGATYTSPAISFKPNYLGLYNMNGNVSEWTLNAYTMNWQGFVNDLNPVLLYDAKDTDPDIVKRKVVKGGSWKDPGSLASPDSRNSEFQDVAKSYIGFRCVMPALEVFNQNPKKSKKH
ncbi:formylglycine-generating enzyme family protein, partial [Pararcticibacter amylolyticus]